MKISYSAYNDKGFIFINRYDDLTLAIWYGYKVKHRHA